MVKVLLKNRKSRALAPSALRCLSMLPTVNVTSGCAHGCVYCYSRGYSQYPGEGRVVLFENTAGQVRDELKRKRKKPAAVYFCPSCDPFQPVPEVLDQTHLTMQILLEHSVGVQFVTKAVVPDKFLELFEKHRGLVCAQIGLTTTDDSIRRTFEPGAASVAERLDTLKNLVGLGLEVSVRADPLICRVTDSDEAVHHLCAAVAGTGVKEIAVSYLFLRPAIRKSLERNIRSKELLQKILTPYSNGPQLSIDARGSRALVLPREVREKSFKRTSGIASGYGIAVRICGCKNPDITSESCNITRLKATSQNPLFEKKQLDQSMPDA